MNGNCLCSIFFHSKAQSCWKSLQSNWLSIISSLKGVDRMAGIVRWWNKNKMDVNNLQRSTIKSRTEFLLNASGNRQNYTLDIICCLIYRRVCCVVHYHVCSPSMFKMERTYLYANWYSSVSNNTSTAEPNRSPVLPWGHCVMFPASSSTGCK